MNNLADLYVLVQEKNIPILSYFLPTKKALCLKMNRHIIVIDYSKIKTENEERIILAEEVGHCATGAFYTLSDSIQNIFKKERLAKNWQVEYLLPPKELIEISTNYVETHEIADYFNVSEELVIYAYNLYKTKGLI